MNIIHVQFNVLQLYKGILATIAAGCGFKYIKKKSGYDLNCNWSNDQIL